MQFLSEAGCRHAFATRKLLRPERTSRGAAQVLAAVKKKALKNVVFSKTLVAKEKYLKKLLRECKSMADFAKKEMGNRENGILEFTVFQDQFDEKQIHFFEKYVDNIKMGRFNSGERFTAFMKTVQLYIEKPVGIVLYEWDNNTIGTASVQGGPKGEGGLDDATGASGMAAGAGLTQTSGVVNLGNLERDEGRGSWGLNIKFPWEKDDNDEKDNANGSK